MRFAKNPSRRSLRRGAEPKRILAGSSPPGPTGLDGGVLFTSALLACAGVVMSYSATAPLALETHLPPLFLDHLTGLGLGLVVAGVCSSLSLHFWRAVALPLWALGVGLLLATQFFGTEVNGAQRWLSVPGTAFRFQPVEIAKFATVLAVAWMASRTGGDGPLDARRTAAILGLAAAPILLVIAQPDLGNAVLLAGLVALILIVAGASWRILLPAALVSIAAFIAFITRNPYAMRRVSGFLDPWKDSQDSGYQLVQSFVGFGYGGIEGVGLGNGWQKLHYLPEAHTDFVLALVAEELGLIGVLAVLGAFAALLVAGSRIARDARNRFGLLLAFGLTALLTLPAAVNAGVVMGLLPTKGLTLPFLSYGRTSLVVCLAAAGVLLGIARSDWSHSAAKRSNSSGNRRRR